MRTVLRRCRSVESDRSLLLPRLDLISRPPWQATHFFNLFSDQIHTFVEVSHDLSVFKESFVAVSVVVLSREVFQLLVARFEMCYVVRQLGMLCIQRRDREFRKSGGESRSRYRS